MTNNKLYKLFLILFSLTILLGCGNSDTSQLIDKALEAEHRTPSYVERDKYRIQKKHYSFLASIQNSLLLKLLRDMVGILRF